jgi:hypothetical protein
MQQMASRPFATINVALEMDEEPPDLIGGNVKVSDTTVPSPKPLVLRAVVSAMGECYHHQFFHYVIGEKV